MPKRNRNQGDSSDPGRARRMAAENEMLAAGKIPMSSGPTGQSGNDPLKVQLVSGDRDFFEALKDALGVHDAPGVNTQDQFKAILTSQQAMTQAAKEISQEMKATAAMMKDLQVRSTETLTRMTEQTARERAADRAQLDQLIQLLSDGGGGGGTLPAGGGRRGGGTYYDPQQGTYTSYGGIGSRINSRLANAVERNIGLSGAGKHENAESLAQRATWSRVAGGLASGGMGAAARRTPYVGVGIAAAEGVNDAAEWLTNQRAQNAQYQSVLGGANSSMDNRGNPLTSAGGLIGDVSQFFSGQSSDSTSGLGNRMAEEGYVLGQRFSSGGFDEQSARALFQGTTSLGYTGSRRAGALEFASANYRTMGMGQEESMRLIGLSAKYAQSSLQGLSRELQNVTKTAVRTGQSAQVMRESFVQNFGAALQASGGAGAGLLAEAATNMTGAGGRLLAGANPLAVLNDPTSQYQMASAMGMTPSQLSAAGQTDPGLRMQALGKRSDMYIRSLGSGNLQRLDALINQSGGRQRVAGDQNLQANVATELMRSPGYDITVARNIVTAIDPAMASESDQAIAQYLVNYQSGNNPNNQAAALREQMAVKPITDEERKRGTTASGQKKFGSGMGDFAGALSERANAMMTDAGPISNLFGGDQTVAGETLSTNALYYDEMTKQAGHNDPVIEKLLDEYGNDPDIRFKVKTKDGEKAVTFGEAIRYFPDQLSNGSATIVSKNNDIHNRQVKDIAGSTGFKPTPGSAEDSASRSWSGSDAATVEKEIRGDQVGGENTGGGNVVISLSPEAQRLLSVQTSGNVQLDNSAQQGRPSPQATGPK